jgi:multiple sugar transport system permease protein
MTKSAESFVSTHSQPGTMAGGWIRVRIAGTRVVLQCALYMLVIIGAVITLVPYGWMLSGSFKNASELFDYPPHIFPSVLRWENYVRLFTKWQFGSWFLSSAVVSINQVVFGSFFPEWGDLALQNTNFEGKTPCLHYSLAQ